MPLVSERIGQLFHDGHRLEYTEYGSGQRWVVLLHGQLMPRRMHQRLARHLAADGAHVVTLDLLGHGRSDRSTNPLDYSVAAFAEQVVALLDELGAERAVVGGTSLGANVALWVATEFPERVCGVIAEMPVLDNALVPGMAAFVPLLIVSRYLPWTIDAVRLLTRRVPRGIVPFWPGIALDTLNQRPAAMAATLHGVLFGAVAPSARRRRAIEAPTLVVSHRHDPVHAQADAEMLAQEVPHSTFAQARSITEWRLRPDRLDEVAGAFVERCFQGAQGTTRAQA